jgi:hypothetical protein
MLAWLKRLFSRGSEPEVEYEPVQGEGPIAVPSGPPTSSHPPAVPVEKPVPEESDRQP